MPNEETFGDIENRIGTELSNAQKIIYAMSSLIQREAISSPNRKEFDNYVSRLLEFLREVKGISGELYQKSITDGVTGINTRLFFEESG